MEVCTINLILNLLLFHVVLTLVTTNNSESTNSSIVKLLHTNTLVCDFENSTQRFRSLIVVDLMKQLYFIAKFVVCTKSSIVALVWKTSNLCTKYCPLECIKTCSRVCIYIFLRSIKTLDPMVEKESKKSNLHESRSVKISETFSALIFSYFFESSLMQNFICFVSEFF